MKIEPCPFCGSDDIALVRINDILDPTKELSPAIQCKNCPCFFIFVKKDPTASWNNRYQKEEKIEGN